MEKKRFCVFQTAETGNRTPKSGVKGSGANHYPSSPRARGVLFVLKGKPQFEKLRMKWLCDLDNL